MEKDNANRLADPENLVNTRFQGNSEKQILSKKKIYSPGGGHFGYRLKAENLISSSPYSWVTLRKKIGEIQ